MATARAARAALEQRIAGLFGGDVDWRRQTGVVHVAAVGAQTGAAIAVGPSAPRSPTDRFMLGFARARADFLVTTAAILRAEPALVHRTAEEAGEEAAWSRWRAEVLGRSGPPGLLVLTASGAFDRAHPALRAAETVVVSTTEGAAPAAALQAALAALRARPGVETIVVEAGPHATVPLYEDYRSTRAFDELLLGTFAGGAFPAVPGPRLPPSAVLARRFVSFGPVSRVEVEEASGPWRFERFRREPAPSPV